MVIRTVVGRHIFLFNLLLYLFGRLPGELTSLLLLLLLL
jgi:hypothetical protein